MKCWVGQVLGASYKIHDFSKVVCCGFSKNNAKYSETPSLQHTKRPPGEHYSKFFSILDSNHPGTVPVTEAAVRTRCPTLLFHLTGARFAFRLCNLWPLLSVLRGSLIDLKVTEIFRLCLQILSSSSPDAFSSRPIITLHQSSAVGLIARPVLDWSDSGALECCGITLPRGQQTQ